LWLTFFLLLSTEVADMLTLVEKMIVESGGQLPDDFPTSIHNLERVLVSFGSSFCIFFELILDGFFFLLFVFRFAGPRARAAAHCGPSPVPVLRLYPGSQLQGSTVRFLPSKKPA
jgi:hypothetical protein